jgi:hypothetical protein
MDRYELKNIAFLRQTRRWTLTTGNLPATVSI